MKLKKAKPKILGRNLTQPFRELSEEILRYYKDICKDKDRNKQANKQINPKENIPKSIQFQKVVANSNWYIKDANGQIVIDLKDIKQGLKEHTEIQYSRDVNNLDSLENSLSLQKLLEDEIR